MANHICLRKRDVFLCLLLNIYNILNISDAASCQKTSSKFLNEPTDKQVKRGELSFFQCSVAGFNPAIQSIRWRVYPDPKSASPHTKVYDAINKVLNSNITVQSSSTHQQLYISCILDETIQQESLCFSSRQAILDTIYFPSQDDLLCNQPYLNDANLGETLTLKCSVPRGNPPVDLTWITLPSGKMLSPTLNDVGSLRVLTHILLITTDLHLNIIICYVSSAVSFPGEKLQCSVGPIMVHHPPQVQIFPKSRIITSQEQVEFTCTADAYPEVNNFTWTCFPEEVLVGCGIASLSRHHFTLNTARLCMPKVEGVYIACSATNSEGTGTSYAYLRIASDSQNYCGKNYTQYTTQPSNPDLFSNLDIGAHLYQDILSQSYVLQCQINGPPTIHSANFKWYIDNLPIIDQKEIVVETHPLMSAITFQENFERKYFTKKFTCKANSHRMSSTASTNLSILWNTQKLDSAEVSEDNQFTSDEITLLPQTEYTMETNGRSNLFVEGDLNPNYPTMKPFIMILVSGAILLIAIIMIIISIYLCSSKRNTQKNICSSTTPNNTKAQITSHIISEYCTNIKIERLDDAVYEVPNAHSAHSSVLSEPHSSTSVETYGKDTSNENPCHDCSIRNSQESSWTNSSDSQSSHSDDISLQYDYASTP